MIKIIVEATVIKRRQDNDYAVRTQLRQVLTKEGYKRGIVQVLDYMRKQDDIELLVHIDYFLRQHDRSAQAAIVFHRGRVAVYAGVLVGLRTDQRIKPRIAAANVQ